MNKFYVGFDGHLYGPRGLKKWSGNSKARSNPKIIKFVRRKVCFDGYLIDRRTGKENWTGTHCENLEVP